MVTERDQVVATFMRDGRIVQLPRQHAKRRILLDLIAQEFEPGERYTEKQVNDTLRRYHDDTAALRRYLVDEEFMERNVDGTRYWRAGGTFEVTDSGH